MCKLYKVTKCPSGVSVSSSRVFMDPDGETIIVSSKQSALYAKLLLELPVLQRRKPRAMQSRLSGVQHVECCACVTIN